MAVAKEWQGSCEDCANWIFHDNGLGHCGLQSSNCINAVCDGDRPTRFLSWIDIPKELGGLDEDEE